MKQGKIGKISFALFFTIMILAGCGSSSNSTVAGTGLEEDYNTTTVSWMAHRFPAAVTDQGIYFVTDNFIYFADFKTMKAKPLCFNVGCQHDMEMDGLKRTECNAFVGTSFGYPFLGVSSEKLYVSCHNVLKDTIEIQEMNLDGTGRKTVIEDAEFIDEDSLCIHRGILYFTSTSWGKENRKILTFHSVKLHEGSFKDQELYTQESTDGNFYLTGVVPVDDRVYFTEVRERFEDGNTITESKLMCYHVSDQMIETVTEEPYTIYGVKGDNLILGSGFEFFLCSKDGLIIKEENGISAFQKEHINWQCHPDCIQDDMMFFTCFDAGEANSFVSDLLVCDENGNIRSEIQGEAWDSRGAKVIRINDEEYLIKFSMSDSSDAYVIAYKKAELMQGKVEPIVLLEWKNEMGTGYSYELR